jgi:heptosyltransferase-3
MLRLWKLAGRAGKDAQVERYLVVRTDKIGDLVLALPAAEAIKDSHPGTSVAFMVSPATAELARACPFVDQVIEWDESKRGLGALLGLRRSIRETCPNAVVFLRPTFRVALAAWSAGIRKRAGTAYRWYSLLFTKRVGEHRKYAEHHETQYNLGILADLLPLKKRTYLPRITLPQAAEAYAIGALRQRGIDPGAFVIIHPGSARSARNLPLGAYARLANLVETGLGIRVLVTGGREEQRLVSEIDRLREGASVSLVGAPGLLELAAVISRARLFISGSTGPMHLAAAVGTPTLSFFSPVRSCSPRRWQALAPHGRVILPPVPECPTCVGRRCEHFDCMERIEVDTVFEDLKQMLESGRP